MYEYRFSSSEDEDMAPRKNSLSLRGSPTWLGAGLQTRASQFVTTFVSRRRRLAFTIFNLIVLCVIWAVLPHHVKHAIIKQTDAVKRNVPLYSKTTSKWSSRGHDKLIANGTLGFEAIYTIGLSDRFDKRDAIELAADVTNLKLTWIDGVRPDDMAPKAIPPTFKLPGVLPGVIGCWRSHMNVIQKIVKEKISTALILEDDSDWDVHIVSQMQQFSGATKELLSRGGPERKREVPTGSPYGEGWDILWLGHCGGWQAYSMTVPHAIIKNDQTVPPPMGMDDLLLGLAPEDGWDAAAFNNITCSAHEGRDPAGYKCDSPRLKPNERIVNERAKPVCTASYAISYQGARKMLARLGGISLQDMYAPLDQGMGDICAGLTDLPGEQTRCLTPSPPYFRGYKPKGPMSGDSDIRKTGTNGEKREVGWSKGLLWSTRLNANNFVSNADFEPESQYVIEGEGDKKTWRYRKAREYRDFHEEVVVEKWFWL
jgi:hypothetical protein